MPLDSEQATILRRIVTRFLELRAGTPIANLRKNLGQRRRILDSMVNARFMRIVAALYLPTLRGIEELEDKDIRALTQANINCLLKALHRLYLKSSDPYTFSFDAVLQEVKIEDPTRDDKDVLPVLILGEEFNYYSFPRGITMPPDDRLIVQTVSVHEKILDFVAVENDWQEILTQPSAYERAGADASWQDGRSHIGAVRPAKYGGWEPIGEPLGEGGQSVVYLVRIPARVAERTRCLEEIRVALDGDKRAELATAIWSYARPELPSELGALKIFKIREGGAPAQRRLNREIAVLQEGRPNLPKLLDANEAEQWVVTEYFPGGTLEKSPLKYKGQPILALRAFRSLVETVAVSLHKDNIVHRDIKPANVFIGPGGNLIPGDFGIAYLPDEATRLTITEERVGPRDYMPQWADLGERLETVQANFDVYMLGKLLWCMIAGRLRLPREYHRRPVFDLATMFPNNKHVHLINSILDKCLVEEPGNCLASGKELLEIVDKSLATIDEGAPLVNASGQLILPCRICGKGFYRDETPQGNVRLRVLDEVSREIAPIPVRILVCNVCTHREFFAPGFPDEAAAKGWTQWSPLKR